MESLGNSWYRIHIKNKLKKDQHAGFCRGLPKQLASLGWPVSMAAGAHGCCNLCGRTWLWWTSKQTAYEAQLRQICVLLSFVSEKKPPPGGAWPPFLRLGEWTSSDGLLESSLAISRSLKGCMALHFSIRDDFFWPGRQDIATVCLSVTEVCSRMRKFI